MTNLPTAAEAARSYQENPASRSAVLGGGKPYLKFLHCRGRDTSATSSESNRAWGSEREESDSWTRFGIWLRGRMRHFLLAKIVRRERSVVGEEIIYKLYRPKTTHPSTHPLTIRWPVYYFFMGVNSKVSMLLDVGKRLQRSDKGNVLHAVVRLDKSLDRSWILR